MTFFYCYQPQQQSAQPGPQSPQSTTPELNTPLPSLLLLSPRTQQQHLTLPLLTPVLPSVPMTTTAATTEHDDQQQLPTPNTFIRHCEDMGLFHDLQNIVVMSPLSGSIGDTVNTSATATTATTNMSTSTKITASPLTEHPSSSNFFDSLSTAMLKTMMMDNPFDETFKQAVLQQEKKDADLVENYFNNSNNNDGELNTPFIATTIDLNRTKTNNSKSASETTSDLVADIATIEPKTVNLVDPKKQNSSVIPSTTEVSKFKATSSSVLITRIEKKTTQKPYSTVFLQRQHQNPLIIKQRSIAPASIIKTNVVDSTSKKSKGQNFIDDKSNNLIHKESESTKAKLVLKQNLLKKQLLQERLRPTVQSEKYHKLRNFEQHKNDSDVVSTTTVELDNSICDTDDHQIEELKKKQEQLERNRTAAKRSRKKRKERWELLSKENNKLKIENRQLRKIISKLIGREYSNSPHQTQ